MGEVLRQDGHQEKIPLYEFPLHTSEIRAEREVIDAQQADLFPSIRRTLGLKLNPDEERESDIPSTLSALTPYDDDLTLGQELSQMCDANFRYVLVAATDPIDIIFLAQQMRKFCRDMVLVTLGYDDLFVHPDLGSTMSGALVVSPFAPSFAVSSFVDGHTNHPFPNSLSQGFYNAFLSVAADAKVTSPENAKRASVREALFLGEIAGARIWPLLISPQDAKLLNPDDSSQAGETDRQRLIRRSPPTNSVRLFAWPALFAGVVHLVLRARRRGVFRPVGLRFESVRRHRLAVADMSMLGIVLLTVLPLAYLVRIAGFDTNVLPTISIIVCIDLFLAVGLGFFAAAITGGPQYLLAKAAQRILNRARSRTTKNSITPPPRWTGKLEGYTRRLRRIVLAFCVARAQTNTKRVQKLRASTAPGRLGDRPGESENRANVAAMVGVAILAFAVVVAFFDLAPIFLHGFESGPPYRAMLRWFRLFDPFAMSSAMPFIYLVSGVYLWSLFALTRITRLDRFPHHLPAPFAHLADLPRRTLQAVCQELQSPWSKTRSRTAPLLWFAFCAWRFWSRLHPSLEGRGFDLGYRVAFLLLAFFLLAELVRFVTLSGRLLEFLRDLAAEPMIDAYDRIANKVSGSFGLQLSARVPNPEDFQISVLTARTLANLEGGDAAGDLAEATRSLERSMLSLNASHIKPPSMQRRVHEDLLRVAGVLHVRLIDRWRTRAEAPQIDQVWSDVSRKDLLPRGEHAHSPTALVLMGAVSNDVYLWMRAAEDFVALRTSTFIYQVLHELRDTLTFALVSSALLAISAVCYPFQPARFLTLCVWSTVVVVVILGLWRMIALERNEVLSRLGGTQPDRIEWNAAFVQQLTLYVALPLAAAMIGLFPGVGDAIAAHLAPIARMLPVSN